MNKISFGVEKFLGKYKNETKLSRIHMACLPFKQTYLRKLLRFTDKVPACSIITKVSDVVFIINSALLNRLYNNNSQESFLLTIAM